jgi:toxin HigB-1
MKMPRFAGSLAATDTVVRLSLAGSALGDGTAGDSHALLPSSVTLDVTHTATVLLSLILSYRDKHTREFAVGSRVAAFSGFERAARLKLDRLEAAASLRDLAVLPGNRFEALIGERKGQCSIRVNDQWRICFEWPASARGPSNVEIVDYH